MEITSFGYNKGLPVVDLLISVRDYIISNSLNRVELINANLNKYTQLKQMIVDTLTKNPEATIAIGCNDGQTISVAVVEQLAVDMKCIAIHRDLGEDVDKKRRARKPVYDRSKRIAMEFD